MRWPATPNDAAPRAWTTTSASRSVFANYGASCRPGWTRLLLGKAPNSPLDIQRVSAHNDQDHPRITTRHSQGELDSSWRDRPTSRSLKPGPHLFQISLSATD